MDIGYSKACDSVHRLEYSDSWTRTFTKIPKFDAHEISMLDDYCHSGEITRAIIYLTAPKFGYALSVDTSEFIVREILRGNL